MAKDIQRYHPRKMERDLPEAMWLEVIRSQRFLTMALCQGAQPYLVSMNYGYSEEDGCFYVHSATQGKKIDILRANPRVWGQITEDRGYQAETCTHHYRSVQFEGVAEFVEDEQEVRRALELMIENGSTDPEPLKKKLLARLPAKGSVTVLRLRVQGMSGKCCPAEVSKS